MIKQMGLGMLKACNGELVELYGREPGYFCHRSDIFHDVAAVLIYSNINSPIPDLH